MLLGFILVIVYVRDWPFSLLYSTPYEYTQLAHTIVGKHFSCLGLFQNLLL